MANTNEATEVFGQYFPDIEADIEHLSGGMINATYRITEREGSKFILQKLAPIFDDPSLQEDFEAVTNHLRGDGWEVPRLLRDREGELLASSSQGETWRLMTYIESDETVPQGVAGQVGGLLAKLHVSLATLEYEPQFKLDHFHDTAHYADTLKQKMARLEEPTTHGFAASVLTAYDNSELAHAEVEEQLIHGDPRTANVLFRDREPFTFIDLDTIMKGSIWIDIGDLLRSLAEDAANSGEAFTLDNVFEVADAYRQIACPETDLASFRATAIDAMRLISMELTMRFLIDVVDDNYFDWDSAKYASRKDHNLARAKQQWAIHQLFTAEDSEA